MVKGLGARRLLAKVHWVSYEIIFFNKYATLHLPFDRGKSHPCDSSGKRFVLVYLSLVVAYTRNSLLLYSSSSGFRSRVWYKVDTLPLSVFDVLQSLLE